MEVFNLIFAIVMLVVVGLMVIVGIVGFFWYFTNLLTGTVGLLAVMKSKQKDKTQ